MLQLADIALYAIHLTIIVYSLLGWLWPRGRRAHLIFLGAILACWFGLGLWKGIGYCPLTDWHWQVKVQLGASYGDLPISFIKHVWDAVLPWKISPKTADYLTFAALFASVGVAVWLNFRKKLPKTPENPENSAPSAD